MRYDQFRSNVGNRYNAMIYDVPSSYELMADLIGIFSLPTIFHSLIINSERICSAGY